VGRCVSWVALDGDQMTLKGLLSVDYLGLELKAHRACNSSRSEPVSLICCAGSLRAQTETRWCKSQIRRTAPGELCRWYVHYKRVWYEGHGRVLARDSGSGYSMSANHEE
jgi:hypothetical protein